MNTIQLAIKKHEHYIPTASSTSKDTNTIKGSEENSAFVEQFFGCESKILTDSNKQSMIRPNPQDSPNNNLAREHKQDYNSFYSKDSLQLDSMKLSRSETEGFFSNWSSIHKLIEDKNINEFNDVKQKLRQRNKVVYSEWSVGRNIVHKRSKPMFEINETKAIKKKLSIGNQIGFHQAH